MLVGSIKNENSKLNTSQGKLKQIFYSTGMSQVTCDSDDCFRLLRVAGLVDEDVAEVVVGEVGWSHSTGGDQSHDQDPENTNQASASCSK